MKDIATLPTTAQGATSASSTYNVANREELAKIMSKRIIADTAGEWYNVKVSSISELQVPASGNPYYIVNLNALTPYHAKLVKALDKKGEYTEASNIRVSTRVWLGQNYVPAKGEPIMVMFTEGATKDGEPALFVSDIKQAPVAAKRTFSFDEEGE